MKYRMSKDGKFKIYNGIVLKVLFWIFLTLLILSLIALIISLIINSSITFYLLGSLILNFILLSLLHIPMAIGGVDFLWE